MSQFAVCLWPCFSVVMLLSLLVGLRPAASPAKNSATWWCLAGLLITLLLGVVLADAPRLLSATERLAGVNFGVWLAWSEFGIGDVGWSFQITPLASWWGVAVGGLICAIGWSAVHSAEALPFGWLGGGLCVFTWGTIFADNVLTMFLLYSALGMCGVMWLGWQSRTAEAVAGVRRQMLTILLADSVGLAGVLIGGLACRTFDLNAWADPEFLDRCWQDRPALSGLAGTIFFLGLLGRCGLFPFCCSNRGVVEFSGAATALVWGAATWPAAMWFFRCVHPLLRVAPETRLVVQGVALLGAVIGAFIAAAQTDRRRTTVLLTGAQFGLLMSASIALEELSLLSFSTTVATVTVAAATVLLSSSVTGSSWPSPVTGLALLILAGSGLTPCFWLAGESVTTIQNQEAAARVAAAAVDVEFSSAVLPPPLPSTTWRSAWCLYSFFAAFASWRAFRQPEASEGLRPIWGTLSFLMVAAMVAGVGACMWLANQDAVFRWSVADWPRGLALGSAAAGAALAAWVCRDPHLAGARWRDLGSWTRLAQRDFYLEELFFVGLELPLRSISQLARIFDWSLLAPTGRWLGTAVARGIVVAGEELRNESAAFYAVAIVLTITVWLMTWLAMAG